MTPQELETVHLALERRALERDGQHARQAMSVLAAAAVVAVLGAWCVNRLNTEETQRPVNSTIEQREVARADAGPVRVALPVVLVRHAHHPEPRSGTAGGRPMR